MSTKGIGRGRKKKKKKRPPLGLDIGRRRSSNTTTAATTLLGIPPAGGRRQKKDRKKQERASRIGGGTALHRTYKKQYNLPSEDGDNGGGGGGGVNRTQLTTITTRSRTVSSRNTYGDDEDDDGDDDDDADCDGRDLNADGTNRRPSWRRQNNAVTPSSGDIVLPMGTLEGGYNKGKRNLVYRRNRRYCSGYTFRGVLPYANLAAIVAVAVFVCVISYNVDWNSTTTTTTTEIAREPPLPPGARMGLRRRNNNNVVAFNLIPTDGAAKTMKLSLSGSGMNFDRLMHYDVCCYQALVFVCRGVTKNMAVDCVIEREVDHIYALVLVNHVDMVGARCKLIWTEDETAFTTTTTAQPEEKIK